MRGGNNWPSGREGAKSEQIPVRRIIIHSLSFSVPWVVTRMDQKESLAKLEKLMEDGNEFVGVGEELGFRHNEFGLTWQLVQIYGKESGIEIENQNQTRDNNQRNISITSQRQNHLTKEESRSKRTKLQGVRIEENIICKGRRRKRNEWKRGIVKIRKEQTYSVIDKKIQKRGQHYEAQLALRKDAVACLLFILE